MNTENKGRLDAAVAAILAALEKRTENTDTIDYVDLAIAILDIENIAAIDTAVLSKSLLLELEKNTKSTYTFDIASVASLIEATKAGEERTKFHQTGVSNRVLENTSMSDLTSILDDFSYPVGEWFIDTVLKHSPLEGRQDICKFLGIRESTLSGWIKEERVPRMAQVALLFLMSFEGLKRQTKIWRVKMTTTIPVQVGSSWGLMKMEESDNGAPKGVLIAEDISNFDQAVQLSKAPLAIRQLKECLILLGNNSFDDAHTMFHDDIEHPKESELYREITETVLKGDKDIEKWIHEFTEEFE